MTPLAAVSPPAAMLVQQSLRLPLQMRGCLQKQATPTCSALKLACKRHLCKHSPRYKIRVVYWLAPTTASVLDLQDSTWATTSAHLGQHD